MERVSKIRLIVMDYLESILQLGRWKALLGYSDADAGDMRTKICFVSLDSYILFNSETKGIQGGAEIDCFMTGRELKKDPNFNVFFITGDYRQKDYEYYDGIGIYKARGIRSLWRTMKGIDADIYFKKGYSLTSVLVLIFCLVRKKRFYFRMSHSSDIRPKNILNRFMFKKADKVFVQNREDEERIGRDCEYVPNGFEIPEPKETVKNGVLWVGRFDRIKKSRPLVFIDLARRFNNVDFTMIIQGNDNEFEMVGNYALGSVVKIIRYVKFKEIQPYYDSSKILVNTSDSEGFPNSFIQAGISSTAILSLKVNPDNFINEYDCGYVCNDNFETMVEKLKVLLDGEYIEKGLNARQYVEQNHDIVKITGEYKDIFCRNEFVFERIT